jgi:anti-repressor protein
LVAIIATKFSTWFPREAARYNLKEGKDFVCYPNLGSKFLDSECPVKHGGHNREDYLLTTKSMRHLSLTCNSEKGFAFREAIFDFLDRFQAGEPELSNILYARY